MSKDFKVKNGLEVTTNITASGNISASGVLDASGVTDGLAAAIVAEIDNDEIPIAKLAEDAVTVTAGTGLTGGGSITLGGSGTVNVIGGDGITANANDIAITAAQTTIESVLKADLVIGEDAQTKIDFETANEIHFDVNNVELVNMNGSIVSGSGVSTASFGHFIGNGSGLSGVTATVDIDSADAFSGVPHATQDEFLISDNGTEKRATMTMVANGAFALVSGDATVAAGGALTNAAAQTNINSILATDLILGEDSQTKIDFETADEIHFYANNAQEMIVQANVVAPGADDGTALGDANQRWSDLFLAEGGVINFDNGDVTITQTGNKLAIAGTDGTSFIGDITASGNISASGTIFADSFQSVAGGSGIDFNDSLDLTGNITASGNISASGDIKASTFTAVGNVDFNGDLDVDGTTNLDVVDIDGAVNMASTLIVSSHISASGNITASGNISGSNTSNLTVGGTITAEQITSTDDMTVTDDLTVGGNINIADNIVHTGDTDTKIAFTDDTITFKAGDVEMIRLVQGSNNSVVVNDLSADIDFRVESNNNVNMLRVVGGTDKVGIGTGAPNSELTIQGSLDTSGSAGHITASGNISSSGTIKAATLDADAVTDGLAAIIVAEIDNDEIPIAKLAEDAVTVTAGTGLTGGGSVTLGGSTTVNVIGGDGITANANDMAITAAQTTIESILKADLVVGEDAQTKIDFETANEIHFDVNNVELLNLTGAKISGSLISTGSFGNIIGTSISLPDDSIPIAQLASDALTVTAGTGLTGGGSITLGGSGTVNVIGGDGITANANDIAITAAQTTIESILKADLVIGEDAQTKIDFETANEIHFDVNNAELLNLAGTTISGSLISTGSFGSLVIADKVQGNLTVATTGSADYLTAVEISGSFVGDGSGLTGVAQDIDTLDAFSGVPHATQDEFLISDNGTEKRATMTMVANGGFALVSGDATIAAGGALTIAANSVQGTMLNDDVADDSTIEISSNNLSVLKVPEALTAGAGILAAGTFDGAAARTFSVDSASFAPFFSASMNNFTTAGTGSFGYATAAEISASSIILPNDAISGDVVSGGTIGTTTITALAGDLSLGDNNITNVGDINADSISVDAAGTGLNIDFGGNTTKNKISLTDNLADALNITEGSNSYMKFITTNSGEEILVSKKIALSGVHLSGSGASTGSFAHIIGNTISLPNNSISGDVVEGGTIASITISELGGALDANNQNITNIDVDSGAIDGTVIGGNSAAAGTFTTINATSLNVTNITSSIVTSSILQTEGSNIFGDASTDTHTFNGHITASNNISASGTIKAATLDADAITDGLAGVIVAEIDNDEIPIAKLAEDAVTVTAGTGLTGGGSITLGGSATVNVIGGDGITANANDMAITAAQTTIESILKADLVIGEDAQTKIDFETANEIHFDVNNVELLNLTGTKISGSLISTGSFGNIIGTTLELPNDSIPIAQLASDALTVTAGTGLTGGGSITLGGSATVNVIGGDGITANANDMAITAAQTTIESILKADLVIGEDAQTKIDFETANEIHFDVNNVELLNLSGAKISGSLISTGSFGNIIGTTIELPNDSIPIAQLASDAVTVTAGTGLTGGGSVTLGGSTTVNVIGGDGITANANDVAITAAQTTIESILKTDLVIGEDAQTKIDFETANEIHFDVNNVELVNMNGSIVSGSLISTASFGHFIGNGSGLTGVTTTVDIDGFDAFSGVPHATQDEFLISDNGTEKRATMTMVANGGFALASGDATIAAGGAVTLAAAQTNVTSLLATDIKIGEDDQTKIDFETADEIHFYAANVEQVYLADNIFGPQSDSDVDLGTTGVRWKDAYIDTITTTGDVDVLGNIELGHASDTTIARASAGAITVEGTAVLLAGAQTGVTSILSTDLVLGEDAQTKIDFETVNEIHFDVNNVELLNMAGSIVSGSLISTSSFGAGTFDNKVGIGTTTPGEALEIIGNISGSASSTFTIGGKLIAGSKSFLIDKPEGGKLEYGVLEGQQNDVFYRGELKGDNVIYLPQEWEWLVDENTITTQLTSIGKYQELYFKEIKDNKVFIGINGMFKTKENIHCYYIIHGTRKDIELIRNHQ